MLEQHFEKEDFIFNNYCMKRNCNGCRFEKMCNRVLSAQKSKVGITFGAFEYLHIGHIKLFQNAKKQCNKLIVCISDDEYIEKVKGHKSAFSLKERIKALKSIKEIDVIDIQRLNFGKKELVKKHKPDLIFVGSDWTPDTFKGEGLGVEVVYLPRTKGVSSTELRLKNE